MEYKVTTGLDQGPETFRWFGESEEILGTDNNMPLSLLSLALWKQSTFL